MQVRKVGVVGCGLMGAGIVEVCARAGYDVLVREINEELLDNNAETMFVTGVFGVLDLAHHFGRRGDGAVFADRVGGCAVERHASAGQDQRPRAERRHGREVVRDEDERRRRRPRQLRRLRQLPGPASNLGRHARRRHPALPVEARHAFQFLPQLCYIDLIGSRHFY